VRETLLQNLLALVSLGTYQLRQAIPFLPLDFAQLGLTGLHGRAEPPRPLRQPPAGTASVIAGMLPGRRAVLILRHSKCLLDPRPARRRADHD
jgi:hypothetical protein